GGIGFAIIVVFLPLVAALLIAQSMGEITVALAGVVVSFLLAWGALKLRGRGWATVGLCRGPSLRRTLFVAVASAVVLVLLTSVVAKILAALSDLTPDMSRFEVLRGNVAALLGGLVIVWTTAAFGEEMLFRGFLMNYLNELFKGNRSESRAVWVVPLIISSIAFGAAHAYQGLAGMIITGIAGLAYGLIYLIMKRNLWAVILAHGLYDTVGFIVVFMSWDELLSP
ncbi:MAG: CPBP family intramembrane glutamic endopeptidase, partial [Planctomycetota bacterium]